MFDRRMNTVKNEYDPEITGKLTQINILLP
jgi:hypothetical protein